jgi:hypothetical protein
MVPNAAQAREQEQYSRKDKIKTKKNNEVETQKLAS